MELHSVLSQKLNNPFPQSEHKLQEGVVQAKEQHFFVSEAVISVPEHTLSSAQTKPFCSVHDFTPEMLKRITKISEFSFPTESLHFT